MKETLFKKTILFIRKLYMNIRLMLKQWYAALLGNSGCMISIRRTKTRQTKFEGKNSIGALTDVRKSFVGYFSYIGSKCVLPNVVIGKYTSIAGRVLVISGQHPTHTHVSTHPSTYLTHVNDWQKSYLDEPTFYDTHKTCSGMYNVSIGNDVWIGQNVSIMEGVTIGDGAIVAACACVVKDVPPYAIVGGVPAKIIRYRFAEDEIRFLQELRWWDKGEDWIKEHIQLFSSIEHLYTAVEQEEQRTA